MAIKAMEQLFFQTPIWQFQAGEEYLNCLQNQLVELNKLQVSGLGHKGNFKSTVNGWRLDEAEKLKELNQTRAEVVRLLNGIVRDENYFDQTQAYACEMVSWINATNPKGHNKMHHHGLAHLSGVLYLQCPEKCGGLVIRDPRPAVFFNKGILNDAGRDIVIKPAVGKCVFFPGFLEHSVAQNESQEVRISYSFNLNFSIRNKK